MTEDRYDPHAIEPKWREAWTRMDLYAEELEPYDGSPVVLEQPTEIVPIPLDPDEPADRIARIPACNTMSEASPLRAQCNASNGPGYGLNRRSRRGARAADGLDHRLRSSRSNACAI